MGKYADLKNILKRKGINESSIDKYIVYLSENEQKNKYIANLNANKLSYYYMQVNNEGLELDGVHVTIGHTGISYDYIAYKNKMLIAYPETEIDCQLVYKGDKFSFKKLNGKIEYEHILSNPFEKKESDILGGYVIIRNKRGEFITTLTIDDINKHKKVAKTQYIWNAWFTEMAHKTLIKKACKVHFDDIFDGMFYEDNKQNDIENGTEVINKDLKELERFEKLLNSVKTIEDLEKLQKSCSDEFLSQYGELITNKALQLQEIS